MAYPISLSYHDTILKEVAVEFDASTGIVDRRAGWPMKSLLTTSSSVYPARQTWAPSAAAFMAALMSAMVVLLLVRKVKSTHDTSAVGTRKAMPVSLPLSPGKHRATALAAPVEEGMMLVYALRPPRQSFWKDHLGGLGRGGRVGGHETFFETKFIHDDFDDGGQAVGGARCVGDHGVLATVERFAVDFVHQRGHFFGALVGAEIKTRLPPPSRCLEASAKVVKRPVDSMT